MSLPPLAFRWDGEGMIPLQPRVAGRQYIVGETYVLEERLERSLASHRHYFACLHEAWINLPEPIAPFIFSPEHLRKRALIHVGYRNERIFVCRSKTQAKELAAFLKPMDEFAVVETEGKLVRLWTAKSQSLRSMDKKEFYDSKEKVLDYVASLIGVTTADLQKNAEQAA